MPWSSGKDKKQNSPKFMVCVIRSKLAKGKAVDTLFSPDIQMAGSFYISKLSLHFFASLCACIGWDLSLGHLYVGIPI